MSEQELATFLSKNGQQLQPMVELIEQCQLACDELIDVTGRAAIQAVVQLSAAEVAGGPPQQGKRRARHAWFSCELSSGQVLLSDRKIQVERPRLRQKGPGKGKEVEIPAYTAMQNPWRLGERMRTCCCVGSPCATTGK